MKNILRPLRRLLDRTPAALRLLIAAAAAALALAGCGGKGEPADPPTQVVATAGDGQVVVQWNGDPNVDWWIFYAPDPSLTLDNWTSITGSRALQGVSSPRVVSGLTNGTQYTFIVNGRRDGGKGGAGSAPVSATPRPAGGTWSVGGPVPAVVNGVARTASTFVAVGNGGAVYTSTDAATWTAQNSGTAADLLAVAFNSASTRLLAVGSGGTALVSADGVTWTALGTGTGAALRGVTAYGSGFLAVGDSGYLGIYDGSTWLSSSVGASQTMYAVANYGNALMVAAGAGGVLRTSTNLTSWTAVASPVSTDLQAIAVTPSTSGSSRFVAAGRAGTLLTSTDGLNWTALVPVVTADLRGLVYGSRFVGVGTAGTLLVSDDGVSWSVPSSGTTSDLNGVAFGGGTYLAGGAVGTTVVSR